MGKVRSGTYVIINAFDCPEDKMIAEVIDPGSPCLAKYVSNGEFCEGYNPTPIADFGRKVVWRKHGLKTISNGKPCIAEYKDGKPRKWQGAKK